MCIGLRLTQFIDVKQSIIHAAAPVAVSVCNFLCRPTGLRFCHRLSSTGLHQYSTVSFHYSTPMLPGEYGGSAVIISKTPTLFTEKSYVHVFWTHEGAQLTCASDCCIGLFAVGANKYTFICRHATSQLYLSYSVHNACTLRRVITAVCMSHRPGPKPSHGLDDPIQWPIMNHAQNFCQ